MMNLVKDEKPEAVADLPNPPVSALISDHSDIPDLADALADQTDLDFESFDQSFVPLVQQIERRHDNQRRTIHQADRFECNNRFAGAGR